MFFRILLLLLPCSKYGMGRSCSRHEINEKLIQYYIVRTLEKGHSGNLDVDGQIMLQGTECKGLR
jgi:hypothetical protein